MIRFFTGATLSIGVLCLLTNGDAAVKQPQVPEVPIVGYNDCEANKATLAYIAAEAKKEDKDAPIIIIARAGNREAAREFNHRRLQNIRVYLSNTHAIPETRIITAEGERTLEPAGRMEIYLRGKLTVVFKLKRNKDFALGRHGSCDGPSGLYYPERGIKSRRRL